MWIFCECIWTLNKGKRYRQVLMYVCRVAPGRSGWSLWKCNLFRLLLTSIFLSFSFEFEVILHCFIICGCTRIPSLTTSFPSRLQVYLYSSLKILSKKTWNCGTDFRKLKVFIRVTASLTNWNYHLNSLQGTIYLKITDL